MKTQLVNFVIPKALLQDVDNLAQKQLRSRSELLREAARRLVGEFSQKDRDFEQISANARKTNLNLDESIALIDRVRAKLRLNK